jgi:hypothetical protein
MVKRFLGIFVASLLVITGVSVVAPPEIAYASDTLEDSGRAQILADTNAARQAEGKLPVKINPEMNLVAQAWAKQMADTKTMSHNPNHSKQIPSGWSAAGENVAAGYKYIAVTNAWMNSPGHKANILADYTDIGIGYFIDERGTAWSVQNFARYKQPVVQQPPTIPTALTASNITDKSFSFTWTPSATNPATITYKLSLYKPDGALVATKSIRGNSTNFYNLEHSTGYKVTIFAQTPYYESALASLTVKTASPPPTAPSTPNNLLLVPVGANKATVSWSAPTSYSAPTDYVMYLYINATQKTEIVTVPSNITTYTFSNIPLGSYYSVRVSAKNHIGSSSAIGSPAVKNKPAPKKPIISGTTVLGSKATINWNAPITGDVLTSYIVEKYDTVTKKTVSATLPISARSHTFNNIAAGSSYIISVRAINDIGTSVKAQSATLKSPNVPQQVVKPTISNIVTTKAQITWKAPQSDSAITSYIVTIKDSANKTAQTITITGNKTFQTTSKTLVKGKTYTVTVTAVSIAGKSIDSAKSLAVKIIK